MDRHSDILHRLTQIELDENCRILYACESGSRAWGFASSDSDYDVRFIYVRLIEWYLSVDEGRDVIERPLDDNLDINGWDLRKALKLLRKGNPPLAEWLGSPIVYLEHGETARRLRELLAEYTSPSASIHHYLAMARGNFRDYLQGDQVRLKKYLYVLRPLLAARWVAERLGPAPTEFQRLVDRLAGDSLRGAIADLLRRKAEASELDLGPRDKVISGWIEGELAQWETVGVPRKPLLPPSTPLDELFREAVLAPLYD